MIRDTLHLLVAQCVALACNYAVHAGLGRMMGPAEYGLFGVIMSLASIAEMVLVRGVRDTVARYTAQQPDRAPAIKRQGLRVQFVFSGLLWLLFVSGAPAFSRFIGAPQLLNPLLITSLIVPLVSLFSVYLGDLSGRGLFRRRALAMNLQSYGKVLLVLGLALMGLGIDGVMVGYVFSFLLATVGAMALSRDPRACGEPFPASLVFRFAVPLMLYSTLIGIISQIDLTLVKSLMTDAKSAGYYTAAKMLSRPAGQIFSVFGFTLLPAISRSLAAGGDDLPVLLRRATRFLWMLLAPLVAAGWAAADALVSILYSSRYAPAAAPFRWLLLATMVSTLASTLATAVIGSGRMRMPLLSAGLMVGVECALAVWLIPRAGMIGAAGAALVTALVGFFYVAGYIRRQMSRFADWPSLGRITLAAGGGGLFILVWPFGGLAVLPGIALGLGLYALLLRMMREVSRDELRSGGRFLITLIPEFRQRFR
jgi:stage V sporulation protein B